MEIGNELSDKIRSAIKAKLVDLGAYVDDELPDYIMVMVANKKTQEQMTEDLNLFLGSNTEKFTAWLSALLAKLKAVTALGEEENKEKSLPEEIPAQKEKSAKSSLVPKTSDSGKNTTTAVEDLEPELTIKPDRDEFEEEERLEKKKALLATQSKQPVKTPPKKISAPKSSTEKVSPKSTSIKARLGEKVSPKSISEVQGSTTRKRKTPGSVVGSIVKRDVDVEEEEYDPHKPMIGKVASTIRVGNRRSSVPLSHQASKSLVLKAVTEAHHSTEPRSGSSKMVSDQISRPVHRRLGELPRHSGQSSRSGTTRNGSARPHKPSERSVELFTRQKDDRPAVRTKHGDSNSYDQGAGDVRRIEIKRSEVADAEGDAEEVDNDDQEDSETEVRRIEVKDAEEERIPETLIQSGAEESDFTDEEESQEVTSADSPRVVTQKNPVVLRPSSPKFVVTLDGVDQTLVSKAMNAENEEEDMEAELNMKGPSAQEVSCRLGTEDDDDDDDLSPLKVSKMAERCRFWPACKMGNDCEYHHPTVACTMFPRCKFGDKCLYIHPNCKFDANCTRPKCPFTHASQRGSTSYPVVIQPVKILPVAKPSAFIAASNRISSQPKSLSEIKCRFFPKCTNMNCPYNHPKPCRYGISCASKATCTFSHPALPSKDQLKWIPPKHSNVTIKLDEQAE